MSTSTLTCPKQTSHRLAKLGDYAELAKPRIATLVLATAAAAGYVARWGYPNLAVMFHTLLGTFLVVASASALNHWIERRRDALMARTANRPLPSGRLSNRQVLLFASATIAIGLPYLALFVNSTAAFWALASWVLYAWIYTPMKAKTAFNTTVGAVAGALPVVIGWTATGAAPDMRLLGLFCLLFLWQFPHFMAIAWLYRDQYDDAGLIMLTVVDPSGRLAGLQAVSSALMLLPVTMAPMLFTAEPNGLPYFLAIALLGVGLLTCAGAFLVRRSRTTARVLLRATLAYLPVMLLLLVVVNSA